MRRIVVREGYRRALALDPVTCASFEVETSIPARVWALLAAAAALDGGHVHAIIEWKGSDAWCV